MRPIKTFGLLAIFVALTIGLISREEAANHAAPASVASSETNVPTEAPILPTKQAVDPIEQMDAESVAAAAGGTKENQARFKELQLTASPDLRAYEKALKARNGDLGIADAIRDCKIRDDAWYDRIGARIADNLHADSRVQSLKAKMTPQDMEVAKAYVGWAFSVGRYFPYGSGSKKDCDALAASPAIFGFDAYANDLAESLPSGAEKRDADLLVKGNQQNINSAPSSREQKIEDARAMVRESWVLDGQSIKSVLIGSQCKFVEDMSAGLAVQKIEGTMQDDLVNSGLIGDPSMRIEDIVARYTKEANNAVAGGACSEFTAAD